MKCVPTGAKYYSIVLRFLLRDYHRVTNKALLAEIIFFLMAVFIGLKVTLVRNFITDKNKLFP